MSKKISVTVTETVTYQFPGYPDAKCSAHGDNLCIDCARNPGDCGNSETGSCGMYSSTGMHWDTCPNRIR